MLLAIGMVSILLSPKPGKESVSVFSQALFLLAFTICFYLAALLILLLLLRTLKPGHFTNTLYVLNHWGMHKKIGAAEYSIPWREFTKWEETKSFFLLYLKNDAHIISKKAIREDEQTDLRVFLKDRFEQF